MILERSMGSAIAVARGLTLTSASNAIPIVATLGADNQLLDQDRLTIFGITGNTAANGLWTYLWQSLTTGNLAGSVGNGAATVTNSVVAILNDRTPFMRGHSASISITPKPNVASTNLTFAIMGNKTTGATPVTDANILAANSTTLATYFEDIFVGTASALVQPGATGGITETRNCQIRRHMYLDCTAFTAGGIQVKLHA